MLTDSRAPEQTSVLRLAAATTPAGKAMSS